MKPAVANWLKFAEIDLRAAKVLLEEGDLATVVCFLSQQRVEKCLKALIEFKGINPFKSNDLVMLYSHVERFCSADFHASTTVNQKPLNLFFVCFPSPIPHEPLNREPFFATLAHFRHCPFLTLAA
jgi:hypothetical protein